MVHGGVRVCREAGRVSCTYVIHHCDLGKRVGCTLIRCSYSLSGLEKYKFL